MQFRLSFVIRKKVKGKKRDKKKGSYPTPLSLLSTTNINTSTSTLILFLFLLFFATTKDKVKKEKPWFNGVNSNSLIKIWWRRMGLTLLIKSFRYCILSLLLLCFVHSFICSCFSSIIVVILTPRMLILIIIFLIFNRNYAPISHVVQVGEELLYWVISFYKKIITQKNTHLN